MGQRQARQITQAAQILGSWKLDPWFTQILGLITGCQGQV